MSDVIRPARDVIHRANRELARTPPGSKATLSRAILFLEQNLGLLNRTTDPGERSLLEADIAQKTDTLRRLIGDKSVATPPLGVIDSANAIREIGENILSDYINVQYHVALSMVPFKEAAIAQSALIKDGEIGGVNLNDMTIDTRKDKSVTLASTGEVFRNRQNATLFSDGGTDVTGTGDIANVLLESTFLADPRNYYNISEIVMENTMAPSLTNSSISQMLTMKMRIAEPHGFKLVEDIKRLAFDQGYRFVNHARAIYRVDLWFSGYKMYDKNDSSVAIGTWVENIPVYNDYNKAATTVTPLSYYMYITSLSAELTANGTMYDVDFVPMGGVAFRPEDTVLDAASMKTQSGNLNTGGTIGDFLDSLETVLPKMRLDSSKDLIVRDYKFYAPQWVRDASLGAGAESRLSTKIGSLKGANPSAAAVVNSARGSSVLDLLNAAFADSAELRDLWLVDDDANKNFLVPRTHMSIRFNAKYYNASGVTAPPDVGAGDRDLNDYKKITLEYLIEPYITYKAFTSDEPSKVKEVARPENQLQRVRNLIKYGMLTRIYNYIWTGLNTEILDLPLQFKNFYLVPLWKGAENGQATRGKLTNAPASNPYANTSKLIGDAGVDRLMKQLFGEKNRIQEASAIFDGSNPYTIFNMGSMNTAPDVDPMMSQSSERNRLMKYLYYENDHFENDMLRLEGMNIKGDPIWLMSPYASARINPLTDSAGVSGSGAADVKIQPQSSRVIFLRMNVPNQDDYMGPKFFADGLNKHPHIIGGFYEVLKVTSTFSGGKFLQKVDAVKIANLNFAEELFQFGPNRVYFKAGDPSMLGSPDEGRPTPEQTSGIPNGPTNSAGVGGAQLSRPLTTEDVKKADEYFNSRNSGDYTTLSSEPLTREQKILVARAYFMNKGLTEAQANGVVGNMIGESQMKTSARNKGDARDGTDSVGIMQWNQDRLRGGNGYAGLYPFASSHPGKNAYDLYTQLDYAWQERTGPEQRPWDGALKGKDQSAVTQAFMQLVERPKSKEFSTDRDDAAKLTQEIGKQAKKIRTDNNLPSGP